MGCSRLRPGQPVDVVVEVVEVGAVDVVVTLGAAPLAGVVPAEPPWAFEAPGVVPLDPWLPRPDELS